MVATQRLTSDSVVVQLDTEILMSRLPRHVVPPILLSGDHAAVDRWRRREAFLRTLARRPDLLTSHPITPEEQSWLPSSQDPEAPRDP